MNKDYKNFFGGLDADLDIDSPKDFVNQVSFEYESVLPENFGGLSLSSTPSAATGLCADADFRKKYPLLCSAQDNQDTPESSSSTQDLLTQRRNENKGKGVSAFAKGLSQGLGLITGGQTPPPNAGGVDTDAKTAGYTNERRNPVIPILIGLIGVAVLVFAISKSKKGQAAPMPMPMPTA